MQASAANKLTEIKKIKTQCRLHFFFKTVESNRIEREREDVYYVFILNVYIYTFLFFFSFYREKRKSLHLSVKVEKVQNLYQILNTFYYKH